MAAHRVKPASSSVLSFLQDLPTFVSYAQQTPARNSLPKFEPFLLLPAAFFRSLVVDNTFVTLFETSPDIESVKLGLIGRLPTATVFTDAYVDPASGLRWLPMDKVVVFAYGHLVVLDVRHLIAVNTVQNEMPNNGGGSDDDKRQ